MLTIDISPISIPRANINSGYAKQTSYRIQPWGQSSSRLPIILKRGPQARNSVSEIKQKMKATAAFFSNNNSREKETRLNKDHSTNSMSIGKYKKTSKYDSNIYRTKTIKNIDLIQQENTKDRLKRKLSKKIMFKREKNEAHLSAFSTCNSQQKMTAKASRRLQLERKIFMMLSKDKL